MKRHMCGALAAVALLAASSALATYHTWRIEEIFSNADGTIQFVVLHESAGEDGENLLSGHTLTATEGMTTRTYTFPKDLPGGSCGYYGCSPAPTANRYVLIGTNSFEALGLVTPDYVIPDGFVPLAGSVQYAEFAPVTYGSLPIDGKSAIDATGALIPNVARNFFGASASVSLAAVNYQGLWWAAPANSEAGWGINFAHQEDTIFATWFTYDLQGKGTWLVMSAKESDTNKYEGDLLETHGPPFNSQPFPPTATTNVKVGTGELKFTDVNTGDFDYTITSLHGVAVAPIPGSKHIIRQVFGTVPTCSYGTLANLADATNYQDLWWAKPAASESGWGINLNHESDTIFATWFTYDLTGAPLWLVSITSKDTPGVYKGRLLLTSGPTLNASPWPASFGSVDVGSAMFTFANGNNANFDYTVQLPGMMTPITQQKPITRQLFSPLGTTCQ